MTTVRRKKLLAVAAWAAVGGLVVLSASQLLLVTAPLAIVLAIVLVVRGVTGYEVIAAPIVAAALCAGYALSVWDERTCDGRAISSSSGWRCVGSSSPASAPWLIAVGVFAGAAALIGLTISHRKRREQPA